MLRKNVGLIGIGNWGKILKDKLSANSNLIFFANSKTKYEKKLKNIDWIFVATPDRTHFKLVKKFLLKKINVFCEKPLTLKSKQSIELFKIAKKNKVKLYVDDIQIFLKKKIILKKKNYILRKKKGLGKVEYLLYRFAYHDFYFLYDYLKKRKIKKIDIINKDKELKFKLLLKNRYEFIFHYSLNHHKKIHKINNYNLITKKDLLNDMIKKLLNDKLSYEKNQKRSLFANYLIDKINLKLKK